MIQDEKIEKSTKLIKHLVEQIRNNPKLHHEIGFGTQTFELLTDAASVLFNETPEAIRGYCLLTGQGTVKQEPKEQIKNLERIIDKFTEPTLIDSIWTSKGGHYVRVLEHENGGRTFQLCDDGMSDTPNVVAEFRIERQNLYRLSEEQPLESAAAVDTFPPPARSTVVSK